MAKMQMEIHCFKVERLHNSSSITGSVSGGGLSIGGTGASSVSGSTKTTHTSQITAGGKVYTVKDSESFPFTEGDDVVVVCNYEEKTGMYTVWSFINNTNGSRSLQSLGWTQFGLWMMGIFFAMLSIFIIPGLLALVIFWYAYKYTFVIGPLLKAGNQMLLKLDGVTDREKIESILKGYTGKTKIVGYD